MFAASIVAATAWAAPRDVQIVDVDFEDLVLELHNFGSAAQSLSGWQFCSHDENQTRRYSSSSGLNGVSIDAGASLFIHFANDAPALFDHMDRPSGSFALPLDRGPYAIGLYFPPVNFGNGVTIADHVQWSIGGADNNTADERSDEAQTGGVWENQSLWVVTDVDTVAITLAEESEGLVLHGPDDYINLPEPTEQILGLASLLGIATLARRARLATARQAVG
jgi:hypothetical protein